jgi:hypothetical protein
MGPGYDKDLFSGQSFTAKAESVRNLIKQRLFSMGRGLLDEAAGGLSVDMARQHAVPVARIGTATAKVSAQLVEYTIKFEGANGNFFEYKPAKTTPNPPRASVISDSMSMYYPNKGDTLAIKAKFNEDFQDLQDWTASLRKEVEEFNSGLQAWVLAEVKVQQQKFNTELEQEEMLNS